MTEILTDLPIDCIISILSSDIIKSFEIKVMSEVCKLFNNLIKYTNYIHKNKTYKTKSLEFGYIDNSWKRTLDIIKFKNIHTYPYSSIDFLFETSIKYMYFDNITISRIDITKCVSLNSLIIENSLLHSIVGLENSKCLIKLKILFSTIELIEINSFLKKLNLNYTYITRIIIPSNTELIKFETLNCDLININNNFNNIPINYRNITSFSSSSTGPMILPINLKNIKNIKMSMPSICNLDFLEYSNNKIKKFELSKSKIGSEITKINSYINSIEKIYLRENTILNFNFLISYKNSLTTLEINENISYSTVFLKELIHLKSLSIKGHITFDLNSIQKASLETLRLDVISIINIENIINHKKTLKKLSISSVSIDLINLNSIGCCLDLLKLKIAIKGLFVFEDDDFLNPLIGLEKLKYLDLNGVYLFLPQIKILKYLKCIRYINLPRNLSEAASARNPHSRFNSGVMYSFKHNWIRFSKKEKISYRQNQGCELCFN